MSIIHLKKSLKILRTFRTSLHRKKVDDLNKQQRLSFTRFTHSLNKFAQSGNKSIVTDTKQWTTRNVAYASRFNYQHTRTPFSKTSIPIEILLRYKAIFSRAPGHHCRHPRTAPCFELPYSNRAK